MYHGYQSGNQAHVPWLPVGRHIEVNVIRVKRSCAHV